MLEGFLHTLSNELNISSMRCVEKGKVFSLPFTSEIEVLLVDLKPGIAMSSTIFPCPKTKREELFTYLMRANFLTQGTGKARIGLDQNEKNLTLSLGLPYEMNYPSFKERFEEFVNHIIYWKEIVTNFESEKKLYE